MTFLRFTHAKILSNLFTSVFFFPKIKFFIIKDGEITIAERDGAAHVLRCLKVWYDLSNDVLFTAINLVDRFLTKMKVRPKHMSCISVGSLHLATKQLGLDPIDTEDLVAISQVSIDEIFKIYLFIQVWKPHVEWCVCDVAFMLAWTQNDEWRKEIIFFVRFLGGKFRNSVLRLGINQLFLIHLASKFFLNFFKNSL